MIERRDSNLRQSNQSGIRNQNGANYDTMSFGGGRTSAHRKNNTNLRSSGVRDSRSGLPGGPPEPISAPKPADRKKETLKTDDRDPERERRRELKRIVRHMNETDIFRIIRVQAVVRGFMQRRQFKAFQREIASIQSDYFSREEYMETINSGEKYNGEAPLRYM